MKIEYNYEGTLLTTMKTPFRVKAFAQPETVDDLMELRQEVKRNSYRVFFLGKGSNTVFVDSAYDGLIISTLKLHASQFDLTDSTIKAGAGYLLTRGVNWSFQNSDFAFIPWIGIPGTVGGAVFMNAGTTLGESSQVIQDVTYFNFESGIVETESKLEWSYRKNHFLNDFDLAISVTLKRKKISQEEVAKAKEFLVKRKATQPIQTSNCGSVFKNPAKAAAGKLIQDAGLKGMVIGGAKISELHGNFIENFKGASGKDVYNLVLAAQQTVFSHTQVQLEPEVRLIYPHDFLPIPILD